MDNLPTKLEVSVSTSCEDMQCENVKMRWFGVITVTQGH